MDPKGKETKQTKTMENCEVDSQEGDPVYGLLVSLKREPVGLSAPTTQAPPVKTRIDQLGVIE